MSDSQVIKKVVDSKRLPTLFIGAGVSHRYLRNSPNWNNLLLECFKTFDPNAVLYYQTIDKCKRENLSVFDTNQLLGSIAEKEYNEFFYQKLRASGKQAPEWIKQGVSPFKMYLRNRFKKITLKENGYLKKEIRLLRSMSDKISSVITTNYDTFIEDFLFDDGFDVYYKQSDLFKSDRFNIAEIYKIHGCVSDADSIIFTKSDYDKFIINRRLIIAKMLTLFSDSPIIFIGYSLDDENVRNIILDFIDCIDYEDLEKLQDHFIFVEYKKDEKELLETRENIITSRGSIPITKISTDNYSRLYRELNKITPGLPAPLVKTTQRLVKRIVESSLETGTTDAIIIDSDEIDSMPDSQVAIAFGARETILGRYGYSRFDIANLFEDILFDNFKLNPEYVIKNRLSGVAKTTLIPIYKYSSQLSTQQISDINHLEKFLKRNSYESIYGKSNLRNLSKIESFSSSSDVMNYITENQIDKIDSIFKIYSSSIQNFNTDEIRDFSIHFYRLNKDECMKSTFFKRVVMYLDLIENKKT